MNFDDFIEYAKNLAKEGPIYWNHVLYSAAQTKDLFPNTDHNHISGMIGLIGRSYSASPERRSYGTVENEGGYINAKGERPAKRPKWPVRSAADGRGGFFDEVARCLDLRWTSALKGKQYQFNGSEDDRKVLCTVIESIKRFNSELTSAIEKFDQVPTSKECKGEKIQCSDHLSFSSKFLHFYFPDIVFIIDSYSEFGGQKLFSGCKEGSHFLECDGLKCDGFDHSVYTILNENEISKNHKEIIEEFEKEEGYVKRYANHCLRSYVLASELVKKDVSPAVQREDDPNFKPMSRLTDSILMAVRQNKVPSDKQKRHQQSIMKIYGIGGGGDFDDMV